MKSSKEPQKPKRIPFNVSFMEKKLPGRSNVQIEKPLSLPHIIAPKFYTKYYVENEHHEEIVGKYLATLQIKGPREKYQVPITENQRYGWYRFELTDTDPTDRRLNFHKRTDIIVREHLMNYAKIRE